MDTLKQRMVTAPILVFPYWDKEFHVHVDASSITLGTILSQPGDDTINHIISFASRKLFMYEKNYTTTEWEGLAMLYTLQKFKHYLLGSHFKMYIEHSALKYLVNNSILGGRIYRWLLLFQEYDFEVIVKPRKLNVGPYHISWILTREDAGNLDDNFSDAQLFAVRMVDDYFMNIVEFLHICVASFDMTVVWKKQLVVKVVDYQLIVGNLYKLGEYGILGHCELEHERTTILEESHERIAGG
jgi:hypothetical protein